MALTVGSIIRELQKYNPYTEIAYVDGGNRLLPISDIITYCQTYEQNFENKEYVCFYLKTCAKINGITVEQTIH